MLLVDLPQTGRLRAQALLAKHLAECEDCSMVAPALFGNTASNAQATLFLRAVEFTGLYRRIPVEPVGARVPWVGCNQLLGRASTGLIDFDRMLGGLVPLNRPRTTRVDCEAFPR